jgi:hypothetical protein
LLCYFLFPANAWLLQNGQGPVTIRQQNIVTYPTLNIAQCPSLLTKMDTNAGAVVEIWNPHIKQWRAEDIDHSMSIRGQPELLIRFLGVTDCPGHKQLIGEEEYVGHVRLTVERAKRRCDNDEPPAFESRRPAPPAWLPSPSSSSLSLPDMSPSPYLSSLPLPSSSFTSMPSCSNQAFNAPSPSPDYEYSLFSSSTAPSPSPPTLSADTHDLLWHLGYTHVPESKGSWPAGMFARDMAWGLTRLREARGDVETRFKQVFPGATWVRATYYRHRDAFFSSTTTEIECCHLLPRSAGGLWLDWRAHSTGWKIVADKKRKGSGKR